MERTYQAQVTRGIAWLEEHHPGWRAKLDLSTLNLAHCDQCILGQVFGREGYYAEETQRGSEWLLSHGFRAGVDMHALLNRFGGLTLAHLRNRYRVLQGEWLRQLAEPAIECGAVAGEVATSHTSSDLDIATGVESDAALVPELVVS
jgi:hypothetical protein